MAKVTAAHRSPPCSSSSPISSMQSRSGEKKGHFGQRGQKKGNSGPFRGHFGGIWSDFGAFWGRIFSQFRTKRRGQKWAFLGIFDPFSTIFYPIFIDFHPFSPNFTHFYPFLPIFTHSCPIFTQIFPYFQPISIQFSDVFVRFSPNFQPILTQNSSPRKWEFGDFQSVPQKFTFSAHFGGIWSDFGAFWGRIFSQFRTKMRGQKWAFLDIFVNLGGFLTHFL